MCERNLLACLAFMENPKPSLKEIKENLAGHLWREPSSKTIFEAWAARVERGETADMVGISAELALTNRLGAIGGSAFLAKIAEECADVNDVGRWMSDLLRLGSRKKAMDLAKEVGEAVAQGKPLNGKLEELKAATDQAAAKVPEKTWDEAFDDVPILKGQDLLNLLDTPIPYLIPPILIKGCLTQIHGAPKSGKSVFSLYLSCLAATGECPEGPIKIDKIVKTLYLTWEDSAWLVSQRAVQYTAGLGFGNRTIPAKLDVAAYLPLWLDHEEKVKAFERMLATEKYELIVFDTLSYFHSAEENDASEMKAVMARLRKLARDHDLAVLYVHHRRKEFRGKGVERSPASERSRGSTAISAAADVIIDWGDRSEDSNLTPVEIRSKYGYSKQWEVEYQADEDGKVRWTVSIKTKLDVETKSMTAVLEMLRELAPQSECGRVPATTLRDIGEQKGIKKSTVYSCLKRLEEQGKARSRASGNGRTVEWMLPGMTS
jgi:uncharacterized protein YbaA (DUF1428 family)